VLSAFSIVFDSFSTFDSNTLQRAMKGRYSSHCVTHGILGKSPVDGFSMSVVEA